MIGNDYYDRSQKQPLLSSIRWPPGSTFQKQNNNSSASENANRPRPSAQTPAAGASASARPVHGASELDGFDAADSGFDDFYTNRRSFPEPFDAGTCSVRYKPQNPYDYESGDRIRNRELQDFQFDRFPPDDLICRGDPAPAQSEECQARACRDEGPFVFGVHSPSQFQLGNRFQHDDTYDHIEEGDDKYVIDKECNNLYCDKNINVQLKIDESKRMMCQIKDKRKESNKKVDTSNSAGKERHRRNMSGKGKHKIKCLLIGDGAVGKTSLITSYAQNMFQYDYKPTAFDNYNVVVEVDDRPVSMEICDTAGMDSLDGLRELCYPGTDVIILCFSVVKPESFRSIVNRWAPGVSSIRAPLILVGTQCDLRDNYNIITDLKLQGESPVSESEAILLGNKLNAPYIETSSKTRRRLKDAFDSAIVAALPVVKSKKPFWKKIFCFS